MGWEPQQVGPNPFFVGKHCELLCWLQRSWFFRRSQKEILRTSMGMPFTDSTMPFTF